MPEQNVPSPITRADRRAAATQALATASGLPLLTSSLLVDAADVIVWALFAHLGADDIAVRRIADELWAADR